ncbi:RebB family R body protein [Breoghania sp. L-A4]|uniref:RebB family R body protein n=1 Tax=Breoghania sp. L-A4 TaxID=2304600 RepID=UPI000E35C4A5|nr:RebB family R body protein [Breoghania sp. L-A4]AXS41809.1 hypothetical protein D1F64_19625 [Breoghania sp. L-A4]
MPTQTNEAAQPSEADEVVPAPQRVAAAALMQVRAQSANLSMINAVQAQQNASITANAAVVSAVTRILAVSAVAKAGGEAAARPAKTASGKPAQTAGQKAEKAGSASV